MFGIVFFHLLFYFGQSCYPWHRDRLRVELHSSSVSEAVAWRPKEPLMRRVQFLIPPICACLQAQLGMPRKRLRYGSNLPCSFGCRWRFGPRVFVVLPSVRGRERSKICSSGAEGRSPPCAQARRQNEIPILLTRSASQHNWALVYRYA